MTAMRTIFLPDRQYTYYLGVTLNRAGIPRYRKYYGDRPISPGLFLLCCFQHLLAGGGELVALLGKAGDDTAAAGHDAFAVFLVVTHAGIALSGSQLLREGGV